MDPVGGRGADGRPQLAAAEVAKVRREVARHAEFTSAVEQVIEVNEKICEARPVAGHGRALRAGGRKRGLFGALAAEKPAGIGRLAAEAATVAGLRRCRPGGGGGGDPGRDAAAGGGMLGQLLAADPGYRGPRVPCGPGHEAEFVSYRDKVTGTVLGPVTLTRAWYHCAECRHGLAPRDAGLGVAGASMSPGLAAMNDLAAAAGPFAGPHACWRSWPGSGSPPSGPSAPPRPAAPPSRRPAGSAPG